MCFSLLYLYYEVGVHTPFRGACGRNAMNIIVIGSSCDIVLPHVATRSSESWRVEMSLDSVPKDLRGLRACKVCSLIKARDLLLCRSL